MKKLFISLFAVALALTARAQGVATPWRTLTQIPSPTINATGDVTGNVTLSPTSAATFNFTLANTTVTPGTYGSATLAVVPVVDAKGRITGMSTVTMAPLFASIGSKPTTLAGYGIGDALTAAQIAAAYQPLDATLTSLAAFNSNGLLVQTAADTFAARTLTGPAAGLTVTNGNGVAGNPTLALANDLAAVEGLASTGLAARTATDTWTTRTLTAGTGISVSNGDGVAGNPTVTANVTSVAARTGAVTIATTDLTDSTATGRGVVTGVTQTANTVLAGPTTGSAAAPTWRALVTADTQAADAPNRNALAPRGGVAFDGTSSSSIAVLVSSQPIGTDDFSIVWVGRMPTVGVGNLFGLTTNYPNDVLSTPNGFNCLLEGSGNDLLFYFTGTSGGAWRVYTAAGGRSNFSGKEVHVACVRSGATFTVYINGVAQTLSQSTVVNSGSAPSDSSGTIGGNYLICGPQYVAAIARSVVRSLSLYNLALAQADVQEIYELGGAVPERFKFGSEVQQIANASRNADFSAGATDWKMNGGGSLSAAANNLSVTGGLDWAQLGIIYVLNAGSNATYTRGKRQRIAFDYVSGAATSFSIYLGGNLQGSIAASTGTRVTFEWTNTTQDAPWGISGNGDYVIDNVVFQYIGAVVHLPLDDGIGFQAADSSTNNLDGVMTTTGVTHVLPKTRGVVRYVTSTNGNQQILGQQALPANSRIMSWTINASGASTVSLGNASAGTQFLSSGSVASGLNDITLTTRFDSTNNLWVTSNNTNTLTHTIFYETVR